MAAILQYFLDQCYYARRAICRSLAYFAIRAYGIEVTYDLIKKGSYDGRVPTPLHLDTASDLDTLLDMAKDSMSIADRRRGIITDKCKTLFTLGSLLIGVVGLLLPKYLAFDSIWMKFLAVAAVAILFKAFFILLVFFDVGQEKDMSLEQADVPLDAANLRKSLLNRYRECSADIDNRTDYLVDVYRVARFCFLSAASIVAGLVVVSLWMNSPSDQNERLVREIRSDATLIEILRGPQGNRGAQGERGESGADGHKGERGARGENGRDAQADDIVDRLLNDQRFLEAVQNELAKRTASPIPH